MGLYDLNFIIKIILLLWNVKLFLLISLATKCVKGNSTSPSSPITQWNSVEPKRRFDFGLMTPQPSKGVSMIYGRPRIKTKRRRTKAFYESAIDPCDYLAITCLRAYQTGRVCGRTIYNLYYNFKSYCLLDYANCRQRFNMWQAIHMGDCIEIKMLTSDRAMTEESSKIMDEIYMEVQDHGN